MQRIGGCVEPSGYFPDFSGENFTAGSGFCLRRGMGYVMIPLSSGTGSCRVLSSEVTAMKTTIYLLRHGQSRGNAKKCFLGQSNWDLSPMGEQQAECAAEALQDLPLDRIYSSDLIRAWHTVQPVAVRHRLPILSAPGFREIDAGQWETHPFDELETRWPEAYHCWRTDIAHACPTGGESVAHLYERVFAALEEVEAENRGKTVLIGTHATPIRMLMARISGGCLEAANEIAWVPNASVTKLVWHNGVWTLDYAGDDRHLGQLHSNLPANV